MHVQLKNGDKVFLILGLSKKGCGIFQCIDPLGKCGCDYIGEGCFSVHVSQSFHNTCSLPYLTIEANTMFKANSITQDGW